MQNKILYSMKILLWVILFPLILIYLFIGSILYIFSSIKNHKFTIKNYIANLKFAFLDTFWQIEKL